ncbi:hypothetical protein QQZ08_003588 [Neonectria magnoliae]|uniref:Uncharacterized protein n=1 Tax=Neonectria magnoliae TaxID=2732573 RepID=A0ABR1I9I7_9HYPO
MGKHSSNTKPDQTHGSKEPSKGQAKASAPTTNLTGDLNGLMSTWNGVELADVDNNTSPRIHSPMMARFLSDSEAPFTGLPRSGRWDHNIVLQGGRRTMTVRATQGSASEVDQHLDENSKTKHKDRKERKQRQREFEKQHTKK